MASLIKKFAQRIDADSGYDNLLMAQDLAEIAKEHYAKQCNIANGVEHRSAHTENPRLENPNDIYYSGYGPTWGADLDGNWYYKRYSNTHTKTLNERRFSHLWEGAIVDDDERMKRPIREVIREELKPMSKNSIPLQVTLREALAKYWFYTEYVFIDNTDHKKAEESRNKFNKWIDENLDSFNP